MSFSTSDCCSKVCGWISKADISIYKQGKEHGIVKLQSVRAAFGRTQFSACFGHSWAHEQGIKAYYEKNKEFCES